jgi:hypothetical protein
VLLRVGANERYPPIDDERLRACAAEPDLRDPARHLLQQLQQPGRSWFVKDPRFRMLLPFWNAIWDQVCFVVPVRHPLEIAASLQRMVSASLTPAEYPVTAILLEWQLSMTAVLRHTADFPTIFIDYGALIYESQAACTQLCEFLDRYIGPGCCWSQRREPMLSKIDGALHRQRRNCLALDESLMTPEQHRLYQSLLQKVADPTYQVELPRYPAYPGWREYLRVVDLLFQLRMTGNCDDRTPNLHALWQANG